MKSASFFHYWLPTSRKPEKVPAMPPFWKRLPPKLREESWVVSRRLVKHGIKCFMFCAPDGGKEIVMSAGKRILAICVRSPIPDPYHQKAYLNYLNAEPIKQQVDESTLESEFNGLPQLDPQYSDYLLSRVGELLKEEEMNVVQPLKDLLESSHYFAEDTRMFRMLSGLRILFVKPKIKVLVVHRSDAKRTVMRFFDINPAVPFPLRPPIICCLDDLGRRDYESYRSTIEGASPVPSLRSLGRDGRRVPVRLTSQQCWTSRLDLYDSPPEEWSVTGLDLSGTSAAQLAKADGVFVEFWGKEVYRQDIALIATAVEAALDPKDDSALSALKALSGFENGSEQMQFTDLTVLFSRHLQDFAQGEYQQAIDRQKEFCARMELLHDATSRIDYSELEENQIIAFSDFVKHALTLDSHPDCHNAFRKQIKHWGQRLQDAGFPLYEDVLANYALSSQHGSPRHSSTYPRPILVSHS